MYKLHLRLRRRDTTAGNEQKPWTSSPDKIPILGQNPLYLRNTLSGGFCPGIVSREFLPENNVPLNVGDFVQKWKGFCPGNYVQGIYLPSA